jgi:hypothetical protein
MKVSTISETVEVSGQSPVVDTVSVAGVSSIAMERIESVPLGSGIQNLLPLAAGVSLVGTPDVGDSQLASRQRTITYGVTLTPTLEFEGINSTTARQGNTALYLNSFQLEEASFKTTGNNADVAFGGVHQQMIMKTGGDAFHGSVRARGRTTVSRAISRQNWQHRASRSESINYYRLECGFGYAIRSKVWFYGASSQADARSRFVEAQCPGCWTCPDAPAKFIRILDQQYAREWQISQSNKLIGTFMS